MLRNMYEECLDLRGRQRKKQDGNTISLESSKIQFYYFTQHRKSEQEVVDPLLAFLCTLHGSYPISVCCDTVL